MIVAHLTLQTCVPADPLSPLLLLQLPLSAAVCMALAAGATVFLGQRFLLPPSLHAYHLIGLFVVWSRRCAT